MPDTLQKLHQNSKSLEENQTTINQRINGIQQRIDTIEKDVRITETMPPFPLQIYSLIFDFLIAVFRVEREYPQEQG